MTTPTQIPAVNDAACIVALEVVSLALARVEEARDALELAEEQLRVASDVLAIQLGIVPK